MKRRFEKNTLARAQRVVGSRFAAGLRIRCLQLEGASVPASEFLLFRPCPRRETVFVWLLRSPTQATCAGP
jgi:hypothetical protein